MPPDLSVIVTARNEADRLPGTLAALRAAFPEAPLFVADDHSTDATPHLALQAGARLVRAPRRLGKGGAATAAARHVLREHAGAAPPIIVLCDGDLDVSARALTGLVEALESGGELAVGSFARRTGGGFGIALAAARAAIERATGRRLEAPLSGQRAIRAGTLAGVLPFAPGFGMETGMSIDALRAGARLVEVELDLEHRATGRTARGFSHRGRQLLDIARAYASRRS